MKVKVFMSKIVDNIEKEIEKYIVNEKRYPIQISSCTDNHGVIVVVVLFS